MRPKRVSQQSGHNERKLSILISVFDHFKTAGEVAKETCLKGKDFKIHKRHVQSAMDRYRNRYTHPYLIEERLKNAREGGKVAYKCTPKGRKMACELYYRKTHGLDLKWELSSYGRRIPYHVWCVSGCGYGCGSCQYKPGNGIG